MKTSLLALFFIFATQAASAYFLDQRIMAFGLLNSKKVAITIDDGPEVATPAVLDYLRQENVKASFFLVGRNIEKYPQIVAREVAEGHVIGNHTYAHAYLLRNPLEVDFNAIKSTDTLLQPFYAHMTQRHKYFRPPGGGWPAALTPLMNADPTLRDYVGPIYWSIGGSVAPLDEHNNPVYPLEDAGDEECWIHNMTVQQCFSGYINKLRRLQGGVILIHDVHAKSLELLKLLIPYLKNNGYETITVEQIPILTSVAGPPAVPVLPPAADPGAVVHEFVSAPPTAPANVQQVSPSGDAPATPAAAPQQ